LLSQKEKLKSKNFLLALEHSLTVNKKTKVIEAIYAEKKIIETRLKTYEINLEEKQKEISGLEQAQVAITQVEIQKTQAVALLERADLALEQKLDEMHKLVQERDARVKELEQTVSTLDAKIYELNSTITEFNTRTIQLNDQIKKAEFVIIERNQTIEKLQRTELSLEQAENQKQAALASLQRTDISLEEKINNIQLVLVQKEGAIKVLEAEKLALFEKIKFAEGMLVLREKEVKALEDSNAFLAKAEAQQENVLVTIENQDMAAEQKLSLLQAAVTERDGKLQELTTNLKRVTETLNQKTKTIEYLYKEKTTYEEQLRAFKSQLDDKQRELLGLEKVTVQVTQVDANQEAAILKLKQADIALEEKVGILTGLLAARDFKVAALESEISAYETRLERASRGTTIIIEETISRPVVIEEKIITREVIVEEQKVSK
jgi:chromosome segregation ATPase